MITTTVLKMPLKHLLKKCMYKLHKKIKNKIDAKVRTLDPKIASLPFNGSTELHGKLANLVQINPRKVIFIVYFEREYFT